MHKSGVLLISLLLLASVALADPGNGNGHANGHDKESGRDPQTEPVEPTEPAGNQTENQTSGEAQGNQTAAGNETSAPENQTAPEAPIADDNSSDENGRYASESDSDDGLLAEDESDKPCRLWRYEGGRPQVSISPLLGMYTLDPDHCYPVDDWLTTPLTF